MARHNLLIVDGDARNRRVLEVSLRKAGFSITPSDSTEEALQFLAHAEPDLIISDTRLPGEDGFAFCTKVKENDRWATIPFIFLTSAKAIEDKVRGLELGVDDYLTKPIYIREITTRVAMLLQRKQRERLERKDARTKFSGQLADMAVVDLLQTLEISRKSGTIQLTTDLGEAMLWFRDGAIVDAEMGRLQGATAVYRLLGINDGLFEVEFKPVSRTVVIKDSTQALLMEGMRRVDEWGRLLEQLPPLETTLAVDSAQLADRSTDESISAEQLRFLRYFDGRRSILEVVDESGLDDIEALTNISQFFFEGVLTLSAEEVPDEESAAGRGSALGLEAWETPQRHTSAELPDEFDEVPSSPVSDPDGAPDLPPPPSYPAPFPQLESDPAPEPDTLVPGIPEESAPRPAFGSSLVSLNEGEDGPVVQALAKSLEQIERGGTDVFEAERLSASEDANEDAAELSDSALEFSDEVDPFSEELESALEQAGLGHHSPPIPAVDTRRLPPPLRREDRLEDLDKTNPDMQLPPLGRFVPGGPVTGHELDSPLKKRPMGAAAHAAAEVAAPSEASIFAALDDPEAGAIAALQSEAGSIAPLDPIDLRAASEDTKRLSGDLVAAIREGRRPDGVAGAPSEADTIDDPGRAVPPPARVAGAIEAAPEAIDDAAESWPGDRSKTLGAASNQVSPPASVLRASVHGRFDCNTIPDPEPATPPRYAGDASESGEFGLEGRINAELGLEPNADDERPTLELEVRQDGEQVVLRSAARADDPDREGRDAPEPVAGTLNGSAISVRDDLPAADQSGMWRHPRAPWEYDEYPTSEGAANEPSSSVYAWAAAVIVVLAAAGLAYGMFGPKPGPDEPGTTRRANAGDDGGIPTRASADAGAESPDEGTEAADERAALSEDGPTPNAETDAAVPSADEGGASAAQEGGAPDEGGAQEAGTPSEGGDPPELDPEAAAKRVAEAERLYKYGRSTDARREVDGILAAEPTNARALLLRSNMLIEESKYEEALEAARASVESDPKIAESHLAVGLIQFERGQSADAVVAYRRYLELAPDGLYSGWTRKQVKRIEKKLGPTGDG